jgi:hypothetical protein
MFQGKLPRDQLHNKSDTSGNLNGTGLITFGKKWKIQKLRMILLSLLAPFET